MGVVPVEVGLAGREVVQVVGVGGRVVTPCRARRVEMAPPLGRRSPLGRPPQVEIVIGTAARTACGQEPGVLVAGVIDHQIEHHAERAGVGFAHEAVEILHRSEFRRDRPVVADVVTVVGVRRGENGVEPDGVHAQVAHIVQPRDDAAQIAHSVAVAVLKAAGIDLVKDGLFPPGGFRVVAYPGPGCGSFVAKRPGFFTRRFNHVHAHW